MAKVAARFSGSGSSRSRSLLGTLRWAGYELSAYCVAKTLVILEMAEQGAAVDDILQVRVVWWLYVEDSGLQPDRFSLMEVVLVL
jgi:hypothetical protein